MTRTPEKPTAFSHADLKLLQSVLEGYSQVLNRAVTFVEASDADELWVFKAPSLNRGLKYLRPFIEALEQSLAASAAGQPIEKGTRKSRASD